MISWLRWLMAASLVSLLGACGSSDDTTHPPATVVVVAQSDPKFSILVEAVTAADLGSTLSGTGPFTVFAPTNDAFAALLTELNLTKAQLLADKPLLTTVLKYHVVAGKVLKAAVPTGKPITTLQGPSFQVDAAGADLLITDGRGRKSKITATDVDAGNGVVHVIDKVILPPTTVVGIAQGNPQFSILVEAVIAADLVTALSGAGPFTVFAPTNDAFAALLTELKLTKAQLLADKPLLTTVLKYHVLTSKVEKAGVPAGKAITTFQGSIFKIDAVGTGLVISDGRNRKANITATDVPATNGVVHVIDKVILPADKNIVETAIADPRFSTLVEAVTAAGLGNALSAAGPLTVFAPTNDAFAAALAELKLTKAELLASPKLADILKYHVASGRVLKADVPVGQAITTLQGATFTVDATLAITDKLSRKATITVTDVLTSNGVIHAIDKVILPAAP
jgi:uncharacterized surface protein with fasciclin (FAS1) repeats